jgi:predicted RNA polymerase sigma factor
VQAAIAACHARPARFEDTDWEAVLALYDALTQLTPSPVVELNRAVAVLHADGPQAALNALDAVREDPRIAGYHLLGAVRGDLLLRLGRHAEAAEELERAAGLAPRDANAPCSWSELPPQCHVPRPHDTGANGRRPARRLAAPTGSCVPHERLFRSRP